MRGIADMQFTQPAAQGSWADHAACGGSKMDFTSDDPGVIAAAKQVCRTQCPVREQCLQHALKYREEWGVWGGLDPDERLRPRTIKPTKASKPTRTIKQPRECLICGNLFKPAAPNAQLCSQECKVTRKRIREAAAAETPGTRLCPACRRAIKPRFTTIPNHFDETGQTLCPMVGEPYSITLPNTTGGVAS